MKLMIILGSSRQGRKGERVAEWVRNAASTDGRFEVDYVDLRELNLPFFDEPLSPFTLRDKGQAYTHPEGEAWAQRVGQTEGVLIVTPEYNHGYPGVLKNALDWVGREWGDKPVAFVSYSWRLTGGALAVDHLRSVVSELGLVQVANSINIPRIDDSFNTEAQPVDEKTAGAIKKMFDELIRLHDIFSKSRI